jgi:hypothetical protein
LGKIKRQFATYFINRRDRFSLFKRYIIEKRSKQLELMVFELSKSPEEYQLKLMHLLKLIEDDPRNLIQRTMNIQSLIREINIPIDLTINILKIKDSEKYSYILEEESKKNPYEKNDLKEVEYLLSTKTNELNELNEELKQLQAVNTTGVFIVNWVPPSNLSTGEINEWKDLQKQILDQIKTDNVSIITNELRLLKMYKPLLTFKQNMLKKYRIEVVDPKIGEVVSKINKTQKELDQLRNARLKIIDKLNQEYLKNFSESVYTETSEGQKQIGTIYSSADKTIDDKAKTLLMELIKRHKRELMVSSVELDNVQKNKLDAIVSIMDFNDLMFPSVYPEQFRRIKYKSDVDFYTIVGKKYSFEQLNDYYMNLSMKQLLEAFGFESQGSFPADYEFLLANYPSEYTPMNTSLDESIQILSKTHDPLKFYHEQVYKKYQELLRQFAPEEQKKLTKYQVIYNPNTGKFGVNEAYDGYMFDVSMLAKDMGTQKPIETTTYVFEKNDRTGNFEEIPVVVQFPGKYSFIKIPIKSGKSNEIVYEWLEVPRAAVNLYPIDYDSCSRFKKQDDCKGVGLGGYPCEFKNDRCMANYNAKFGQRKKIKGKNNKQHASKKRVLGSR